MIAYEPRSGDVLIYNLLLGVWLFSGFMWYVGEGAFWAEVLVGSVVGWVVLVPWIVFFTDLDWFQLRSSVEE